MLQTNSQAPHPVQRSHLVWIRATPWGEEIRSTPHPFLFTSSETGISAPSGSRFGSQDLKPFTCRGHSESSRYSAPSDMAAWTPSPTGCRGIRIGECCRTSLAAKMPGMPVSSVLIHRNLSHRGVRGNSSFRNCVFWRQVRCGNQDLFHRQTAFLDPLGTAPASSSARDMLLAHDSFLDLGCTANSRSSGWPGHAQQQHLGRLGLGHELDVPVTLGAILAEAQALR